MPANFPLATILNVASAFPSTKFTQEEMGLMMGVQNPAVLKLLASDHIRTRHLYFDRSVTMPNENTLQKYDKLLNGIRDIGLSAARKALGDTAPQSIDFIVAATSTGLVMPGISAIVIRELGLRADVDRFDLVGMGCNAAVSGLKCISQLMLSAANRTGRTQLGLLLCVEIASAGFLFDDTVRSGIVNSLFGDGAVATLLSASPDCDWQGGAVLPACPPLSESGAFAGAPSGSAGAFPPAPMPRPRLHLVDFRTATLVDHQHAMKTVVDPTAQALTFQLSKEVPFIVGANIHVPVLQLLEAHGIPVSSVAHWVVHSGGAAVIDGMCKNLGLKKEVALRHTISVLRDYGNISSGSLLASFERLLQEHAHNGHTTIAAGDIAVLIGVGPGVTIEVGLGVF